MIFPPAPLKMLFSDQHGMKNFLNIILHARKKKQKQIGIKIFTSNGGYRREEKSHKHWSLFTMLSSSVTANFLFVRKNQEQLYALNALKIREK